MGAERADVHVAQSKRLKEQRHRELGHGTLRAPCAFFHKVVSEPVFDCREAVAHGEFTLCSTLWVSSLSFPSTPAPIALSCGRERKEIRIHLMWPTTGKPTSASVLARWPQSGFRNLFFSFISLLSQAWPDNHNKIKPLARNYLRFNKEIRRKSPTAWRYANAQNIFLVLFFESCTGRSVTAECCW